MTSNKIKACSIKVCCITCKTEITLINFSKHVGSNMCIKRAMPKQQKTTRIYDVHPKSGKKGGNQFTKAKELGLPPPIVSEETRRKISVASTGRTHTAEYKENHSKVMKNAVKCCPTSYMGNSGRVKRYLCSNGFNVIGQWEVKFVEYCILHNIKIIQPTWPFDYVYKNSIRSYFPDFYLPEFDMYIEVKGFFRDKDFCKISQFPENIHVIGNCEISQIKRGVFSISSFLA